MNRSSSRFLSLTWLFLSNLFCVWIESWLPDGFSGYLGLCCKRIRMRDISIYQPYLFTAYVEAGICSRLIFLGNKERREENEVQSVSSVTWQDLNCYQRWLNIHLYIYFSRKWVQGDDDHELVTTAYLCVFPDSNCWDLLRELRDGFIWKRVGVLLVMMGGAPWCNRSEHNRFFCRAHQASSGLFAILWDTLACFGMFWDVLGCFGISFIIFLHFMELVCWLCFTV